MKRLFLLKELQKYAIFNVKIVKDIVKKDRKYVKLVIHRLKKDGLIFQIEKDRYTVHNDPLIVSSHIVWPSYISGWSGLRYHNLTEQLPVNITVLTTRQRKNKKVFLGNVEIEFVKIRNKFFFGYKIERYYDFDIFIGEKEKVLIDCALFKLVSFSEIYDGLRHNIKSINVSKLINYLKRVGNKTLIKRIGFLLDILGVDKYAFLKRFVDLKYVQLDYFAPKRGFKNRKWRIIKNVKFERNC